MSCQLLELSAVDVKEVRGARIRALVVVAEGAHNHRVTGDADGGTEEVGDVACSAIRCFERRNLRAAEIEDEGSPVAGRVVIPIGYLHPALMQVSPPCCRGRESHRGTLSEVRLP